MSFRTFYPFHYLTRERVAPLVYDSNQQRAVFTQKWEAEGFKERFPTWDCRFMQDGEAIEQSPVLRLRAVCLPADEVALLVRGEKSHFAIAGGIHTRLFTDWVALYATQRRLHELDEDVVEKAIVAVVRGTFFYPDAEAEAWMPLDEMPNYGEKRPLVGQVLEIRPLPQPVYQHPKGWTWLWQLPSELVPWAEQMLI